MTIKFGPLGRCRRVASWLTLSAACLALGACANGNVAQHTDRNVAQHTNSKVTTAAPKAQKAVATSDVPKSASVGTASWYGPGFHGRRTANGETYDMHALTAAHPTLPLRSVVRVTNLANQRSVVVRVNDRGPFVGNRMIDVSAKSAQLLGFYDRGLAKVKVELVGGTAPKPAQKPVETASATP